MSDDDLLLRAERAAEKLRQLLGTRGPGASAGDEESNHSSEVVELLVLDPPGEEAEWALTCGEMRDRSVATAPTSGAVPPLLSELARQVPAVAQAIVRREMFELIGPASVLRGLREGAMELIPSKTGGLIGGVRKIGGHKKIIHQARFRRGSLASAMGPQLVFSLVTAAVGAAHLAEIHRQIARVNERLDLVLETLQSGRHGVLVGAVTTLREVVQQHAATGTFSPAMLQRLVLADHDIRQVREQLRRLHENYRARSLDGADLAKLEDAFGTARAILLHDARMTVLAEASMIEVERMMLAYEYEHEPQNAKIRVERSGELPQRINALGNEVEYLGVSARTARLRLGELSTAIHRQVFSAERMRTCRARLNRDQEDVAELEQAIQCLGHRPLTTSEPQVVRVVPRGAGFDVSVAQLGTSAE